ncbi:MAG: hypothetical protein ACT6XY_07985 [Phreatobacter sp.]|jgi:hypothetical protein|uniref:hypothetical protein n=1 Tax=Phreatobacter sp. TaxID=1966341 RepID=UPI0040374419
MNRSARSLIAVAALAAIFGLAVPAGEAIAQGFERPPLPRITPSPHSDLPPIAIEPQQRRRRNMPGGAATPFFTLPDGATPFTPQMGTPPALMPSIPGLPGSPGLPPQFADRTAVALDARYRQGGQYVRDGLHWRIFADTPEASGAFALVAESRDPAPVFALRPGSYIMHVAFGTFAQTRRLRIAGEPYRESIIMNAGAVRLVGKVGESQIRNARLSFDIFAGGLFDGGEPRLVLRQAPAGDLIALPEGTYHVVSIYGDANATIRADLRIRAGQVTDATIQHRAANVSLKLVQQREGGEAIGNAAWTVLTPGGDVIKESIGAFPSMVLQEGEYLAIARHEGRVFNRRFTVEAGKDQNIEVVAR